MAVRETDAAEASEAAASRTARSGPSMGWPIFMLFVSGIIWGLFYSLNRFAVTGGIPFLAYVFWIGVGAAIIMFVLCLFTRSLPSLQWAHLRAYLVLGVIGVALPVPLLSAPSLN